MRRNTTSEAAVELIGTIKSVRDRLNQGYQLLDLIELIDKVNALGGAAEVKFNRQILDQLVNLLQSLVIQGRPLPTLSLLKANQQLIKRINESIPQLGDLDLLANQIALIQDAETALHQQGDITSYLSQIADMRPQLDALRSLIEALSEWHTAMQRNP